MQAYPLAVYLNSVAVDYRGRAGHVCQGRGGEQTQGDDEGVHRHIVPRLGQKESPAGVDLPAAMSASLRIRSASPLRADLRAAAARLLLVTLNGHRARRVVPLGTPPETRVYRTLDLAHPRDRHGIVRVNRLEPGRADP